MLMQGNLSEFVSDGNENNVDNKRNETKRYIKMKGRIASSEKPTDMKKHIRTGLSRPHEPLSATALVAQGWAVGGASLVAHRELRAVAWRCVDGNPSPVWKLPIVGVGTCPLICRKFRWRIRFASARASTPCRSRLPARLATIRGVGTG